MTTEQLIILALILVLVLPLLSEVVRLSFLCSKLQEINESLAERVADQSELLSRRSEKSEKSPL
jgi:hypothetical protein